MIDISPPSLYDTNEYDWDLAYVQGFSSLASLFVCMWGVSSNILVKWCCIHWLEYIMPISKFFIGVIDCKYQGATTTSEMLHALNWCSSTPMYLHRHVLWGFNTVICWFIILIIIELISSCYYELLSLCIIIKCCLHAHVHSQSTELLLSCTWVGEHRSQYLSQSRTRDSTVISEH